MSPSNSSYEERLLKINYPGSQENFEVPIEENGRVSFKDITSMDSKVVGLVLQIEGSIRFIKPKNGYFKEPKEKWETFIIFAFLNKQSEAVEDANIVNARLNNDGDTLKTIKIEPCLRETNESNQNQIVPASLLLSSAVDTIQRDHIKTEAPATATESYEHESSQSSLPLNNLKSENDNYAPVPAFSNVLSSGFIPAIDTTGPSVSSRSTYEPTNKSLNEELFAAYNVASCDELKYMLCKGNHDYYRVFNLLYEEFKKTLIAHPNDAIVQYMHYAYKAQMLLKDVGLTLKETCDICDIRSNKLTLKHLIVKEHAMRYHKRYHADPPEVVELLKPEICNQFIPPHISYNFSEYKKMEESPEFSIEGCLNRTEAIKLKYTLICRIQRENLTLNYRDTFSIEKLVFLQMNISKFFDYFTVEMSPCNRHCKSRPSTYPEFLSHLISANHFQNKLNQEQLNDICKVVSFIRKDQNGLLLQPSSEMNARKRQFEPPTLSSFPPPDYKRYRNE